MLYYIYKYICRRRFKLRHQYYNNLLNLVKINTMRQFAYIRKVTNSSRNTKHKDMIKTA